MRSKCFNPVLEAFRLHVYKLCAAALQANCVGDSKLKAYLNDSRSYRVSLKTAWFYTVQFFRYMYTWHKIGQFHLNYFVPLRVTEVTGVTIIPYSLTV